MRRIIASLALALTALGTTALVIDQPVAAASFVGTDQHWRQVYCTHSFPTGGWCVNSAYINETVFFFYDYLTGRQTCQDRRLYGKAQDLPNNRAYFAQIGAPVNIGYSYYC